jgi:hypothetical protein
MVKLADLKDFKGGWPGSLPVVYLVTQVGNWGLGNDDVGLIQSTKAPNLSREQSAYVGSSKNLQDLQESPFFP